MREIVREQAAVLHVFTGQDDYSIRQAADKVKSAIGDPTAMMTNTAVFDGRQVSAAELHAACVTMPFLADKRLVIVNGLLERFESGAKGGRKKSAKKTSTAEEWEAFAALAQAVPDFTELILISGVVKPSNPLLNALVPTGRVMSFPALRPGELRDWVSRRVEAGGGRIALKAQETLCRFVGNDLWLMAGEVDKLIQYVGGAVIEENDVIAVVSATREASVFSMVDAILEGRAGYAQELYNRLLTDGSAPTQLLVMIARQVRIIYQIREMRREKKTRADIRSALGLNTDFVMNKAWEQADKYSLERLREIYHRLLDTDIAIKTGRYDGELALTILIAEMGPKGEVKA